MSRQSELAALGRVADTGALSNRRLTYNGAMNVWQRGTSADTASDGDYTCDRWRVYLTGTDGNLDWDQETSSTPDGFAYALKLSMDASETSLDAGDYVGLQQRFEGQDFQHLQKGTSGAKKLALSFWVRSSVASTYTVELEDSDNSRVICKTYTVDTADTWEYKTVIFEGDTTGTITNDANVSLSVNYWLDAGSTFTSGTLATSWESTTSANRVHDTTGWLESSSPTFYITGVQLEVGDTATPFEHRSYGDELARCQRYYQRMDSSTINSTEYTVCVAYSTSYAIGTIPLRPFMRTGPTASSSGTFQLAGASGNVVSAVVFGVSCEHSIRVRGYSSGNLSTHGGYRFRDGTSGDTVIELDAEL